MRETATPDNTRLAPVFAALAEVGLAAEPAVYAEEFADEVRGQLLGADGVLVWVDPVTGRDDRSSLDVILRDVAATGVWVSAHPDVILKMGTKEVLYQTRQLGWGSDVDLYRSLTDFTARFPSRLADGEARVLKQYRGNGGIGVWKVEVADSFAAPSGGPNVDPDGVVRVQSARNRDEVTEDLPLREFMARCGKYFDYADGTGRLIDQPFQARITEGIVRCYLVKNEVVGFARQYPRGLSPTERHEAEANARPAPALDKVLGLPAAKSMYPPDEPAFRRLRALVETDWVPAMQSIVQVDEMSLPVLWDADFLFGPPTAGGEDTYVLCEINVSAVSPFPDEAPPKVAAAVLASLRATGRTTGG